MIDDKNTEQDQPRALKRLWGELTRRKVNRVASVYVVTGWIIIQVAADTFESFGIPDWAFRLVTLMVLLGLPVALMLAWVFELTPEGIKINRYIRDKKPTTNHPENESKKQNWQAYAFGALVPTLIFGTLALFYYIQAQDFDPESEPMGAEPRTTMQSIAVMPLVNMSSNAENAYFASGIHEDVLTNLTRIKDFQIISRTSMLRYSASTLSLKEIGNELDVDYIVEGSVRRIGNHVRVTIQLIDAKNDHHIWANNFERELLDVFATQSELSKEISDSLHLELQPESVGTLAGMPTFSVKAFDLYMRAEGLEKTEGATEENYALRRKMLEEAVALDPDFVEAWAVLKRIYDYQHSRMIRWGWFGDEVNRSLVGEQLKDKSRYALNKAIALDPENIETLLSRVVDHTWPKSADEMQAQKIIFDQMLANYPDNAKARYHLAFWHAHLRDLSDQNHDVYLADAAASFEKALKLDPFNARMVRAVLKFYRDQGFEEHIPRIAERLNQILPETASDRHLARVGWNFKRNQIRNAFMETADESYIADYQLALEQAIHEKDIDGEVFNYLFESELSLFLNDREKILELTELPINLEENVFAPGLFCYINDAAMSVFLNEKNLTQARDLAQKIVDQETLLVKAIRIRGPITATLVGAHATLGNEIQAQRLVDGLLFDKTSDHIDTVQAMSHIDLERAVEFAFGELARNPKWRGFDTYAAYHAPHHAFLTHPRVMAYYVKEGKWLTYLAARVPGYAEHKHSTERLLD